MGAVLLVFVTSLFCIQAEAKIFRSSFMNFKLPPQWSCQQKGPAYLCRHGVSQSCKKNPKTKACKIMIKKSREAMIIFTAKQKSGIDSLEAYKAQLEQPKPLTINGNTTQSKVVHNKMVKIKGQKWTDAMHLSSELPHYYTRYLATLKGDVAILATFTAHKLYYSGYSSRIFNSIKSLKVTASNSQKINKNELGPQVFSRPIEIPDSLMEQEFPQEARSSNSLSTDLFILAMLIAGIGFYFWTKRRKT